MVEIQDERPDVLDQVRALQQFDGQRPSRSIKRRNEKQSPARMAGNDSGQQIQVIVDDVRLNHLRRDVDQPGARLTQQ